MKIKKAVILYSLILKHSGDGYSFFDNPEMTKLYFKTKEEADLHQKLFCQGMEVIRTQEPAILDKDKKGNDRWTLILKQKEFGQWQTSSDFYYKSTDAVGNVLDKELEEIVKKNDQSVFVVKYARDDHTYDGMEESSYGSHSSTQHVYVAADQPGTNTEFLYVSGKERWFVGRGQEVTVTSAEELVNQKRMHELQDELAQLEARKVELMQKMSK